MTRVFVLNLNVLNMAQKSQSVNYLKQNKKLTKTK